MALRSKLSAPGGVTLWVLGDQLSRESNLFRGCDPSRDRVLMIESMQRCRALPYHKKKLVFLWSAMRHFAADLEGDGWTVDYRREQESYGPALRDHMQDAAPRSVRLMRTSEVGREAALTALVEQAGCAAAVVDNDLFITGTTEFLRFASGRKTLRMEDFYRQVRAATGLLMDGDEPAGGQWNFDTDNRKKPPPSHRFPVPPVFPVDATTQGVMRSVDRLFSSHPGSTTGFALPTTRADARQALKHFLRERLDGFGPYQDAIVRGEPTLYHSLLAPLLNTGLLHPLEICKAAERAYRKGEARLESVEGFIRQILGWREFVRHVYRRAMPGYLERNELEASEPLPELYWTADTKMECMRDAVKAVVDHATNHHIQRLMITGNFALIAGIEPRAVLEWYWAMYVDAYEWVVAPNVLGMALYADGGVIATKPYAAAANYINKMSDCCRPCTYDPSERTAQNACPFNALYWDFLRRNRKRLGANHRLSMPYAALSRFTAAEMRAITKRAKSIRAGLRESGRI